MPIGNGAALEGNAQNGSIVGVTDLATQLRVGEVIAGEDGPHCPAEFFQRGWHWKNIMTGRTLPSRQGAPARAR